MEGCHKLMKFMLIGFNFLVLIVGVAAIGLGIWALTSEYGANEMEAITGSDLYQAGCIVVIVGGSVIALISFMGCCGAWKENRVLLGIYFFIMLLFLILFVVGAVIGFFFRDDVEDELSDEMEETLKNRYGVNVDTDDKNKAVTEVWDKIQKELECCGVEGGKNSEKSWFLWQSSQWFTNNRPNLTINLRYVPASCCNSPSGGTLDECQRNSVTDKAPTTNASLVLQDNPALFEDGCLDKVKDKIDTYIVAIAVIAVIAFIIMFCCVVFSVCVCMEASRKNMVV